MLDQATWQPFRKPARAAVVPLAVLLCVVPARSEDPRPAPKPSPPAAPSPAARPVPADVVAAWEKMIGTWIADNSAYKGAAEAMDAYGVEWSWGLGRKSMVGRLFGLKDGREAGTFWQFREFWHPGEARVIVMQFGSDGTYGAGPHTMRPDGTLETVQTFWDPDTGKMAVIAHRTKLEGESHTTVSYDVDAGGAWTQRRTYVWRRQRP